MPSGTRRILARFPGQSEGMSSQALLCPSFRTNRRGGQEGKKQP